MLYHPKNIPCSLKQCKIRYVIMICDFFVSAIYFKSMPKFLTHSNICKTKLKNVDFLFYTFVTFCIVCSNITFKRLTCAINKQFMAQSVSPHALENDVISLQCFEVNPRRQCRMHTLCQSLWNFDPSGYNWKFHVTQQHFVEFPQSRY